MSLFSTTLGANSYSNGLFSTVTGAYSIASSDYSGGDNSVLKNFGATITGSLNSIESATASSTYSGIANSIVGTANRTFNSNGSLIFGAGNEITNSVADIAAPPSGWDSAKDLANTLRTAVKESNGGGATLAIGGGNTADYTQASQLIGVNNTLKGTSSSISQYNALNGYKNTAENVTQTYITGLGNTVSDSQSDVVIGDYHTLSGGGNNVVIGSMEAQDLQEEKTVNGVSYTITKVPVKAHQSDISDTVMIGHNADVTVNGGVALGANSVASTDKGVAGYDLSTGAASTETSVAWKSTAAAVSVGDVDHKVTRQITGLAAGTADTDAVNVAQLKAVEGDASQAVTESKKHSSVVAGNNNIKVTSQTNAVGGTEYSVSTADNVSFSSVTVGAASISQAGIQAGSQKITNVDAGSNDTDAVNVRQLKDSRSKVESGDPSYVTVGERKEDSANNSGATIYSVALTTAANDAIKNANDYLTATGINARGSRITGVAAGDADTDAVNVAQLNAVKGDASQAVTESKKHSSVVAGNNNIKVTSQTNAVGGTEYSVSTADNVSFSSVTVGAASISQAGIQAGSQKITNVAPGTISETSTDAVNGSQLYQTNQAVQQNSDDISKLYNRSAELNRKIHRAGAHAAALAALHPLDFDENHRVSASLGLGQYHSSGAAALGIFVRPTENFMVSLGGSIASGSDLMGNLGVHYRFGGDSVRVNKTELTQQVSTLTAENRDLSAKLASSNSKLEAATSKIDSLMERIHAIEAKLNMK